MVVRPWGRKTPGPGFGGRPKPRPLRKPQTLTGSAGRPAESDLDSVTDADASSDDEATALDYSDMPAYLAEEQQAQGFFLGCQKAGSQGAARYPTGAQGKGQGSRQGQEPQACTGKRHGTSGQPEGCER
eukprot:4551662-Pyramimonas_sp.AAC.1